MFVQNIQACVYLSRFREEIFLGKFCNSNNVLTTWVIYFNQRVVSGPHPALAELNECWEKEALK